MKKQTRSCGIAMLTLLASTMFFSCSSDSMEGEGEQSAVVVTPEQEAASVIISDQSRVSNFVNSLTRSLTRAYDESAAVEMPAQPTIPADAVDLTAPGAYMSWGSNGVVPAGTSLEKQMDFSGGNIYVAGEFKASGWNNVTFYVLPGGTLNLEGGIPTSVTKIYNYGTLILPENVELNWSGALMSAGDLTIKGKLSLNGNEFFVGGDLKANQIEAGSSKIHVIGDVTVAGAANLQSGTSAYFSGNVSANDLKVNGSTVNVACKTLVANQLYINGWDSTAGQKASFRSHGYVEAAKTSLTDGGQLYIDGGTLADLGALSIGDAYTVGVFVDGNSYGVVKAASVKANTPDLRYCFDGYMGLHYDAITTDNSGNDLQFRPEVKVNEEDDTYIEESTCHPAYGTAPTVEKPTYVINYIAEVTPPTENDHSHNFSSTSVDVVGDKAYVSYHTQGASYGGCVEVMTFANNGVTLNNYIQPTDDIDFNHILVDNNQVFATGGVQAGSFISTISLDGNGLFPSELSAFNRINLKNSAEWKENIAGNGNCIVRNGENYIIATTEGFLTLKASDLSFVSYKETPASAKYVSLDSKNHMVTLNLADKTTSPKAEVSVYGASDVTLANANSSFTGDVITPNDGKNVCMVDGEDVYVCLGKNGLKRYTNGVENGLFLANEKKEYACNGMDYDDNFIYLAYGGYGLRILDKSSLEEVANYVYAGGKSANFVKVANGYIFVAYGKSGLQVFKLNTL